MPRRGLGDFWTDLAAGQSAVVSGGQAAPIPSDLSLPVVSGLYPETLDSAPTPISAPAGAGPVSSSAASSPSLASEIRSFFYNAATGNLSQDQINALQAQESAALQKAGMTAAQANQIARSDVINAVSQAGALPGSTPSWLAWIEKYGPWIGIGVGGLIVVAVLGDIL